MPREFRCFVEDAEVVVFDHHSDDGSGVGTSDSQPLPGHHHDAVDIRWAALQGLAGSLEDGEKDELSGAEPGVDEKQEK